MDKKYKHLNQKDRDRIFKLLRMGKTKKDIGNIIGRHKSTISRELNRNKHKKLKVYLPDTAEKKAVKRKIKGRKRSYLEKDSELREYVIKKLKDDWSPEQIEGRVKTEIGKYVNYESIYQYIYSLTGRKQNLKHFLKRSHRIRQKKNNRKINKSRILNRIDIDLRPKIVEKRKQFGHWEGDSMAFQAHKQQLATQTERKSRLTVILRPKDKTAKSRSKIINRYFKRFPIEARKTMTFDNGLEFADHQAITKAIGTKIFFAKPYSSWQRGSNENGNGLIRWYLPRNTDLNSLTDKQLNAIMESINNRPKKCLNFKTPNEVFIDEMSKIDKSKSNLFNSSVALRS